MKTENNVIVKQFYENVQDILNDFYRLYNGSTKYQVAHDVLNYQVWEQLLAINKFVVYYLKEEIEENIWDCVRNVVDEYGEAISSASIDRVNISLKKFSFDDMGVKL